MDKVQKTKDLYGFLWAKDKKEISYEDSHFANMQQVITEPIVRGCQGIEIGAGCGRDTYLMAKANSSVKITSLDLSDGVYKTKQITRGMDNVNIIKGSVLELPIKNNTFDFAYSFGVLHHTLCPEGGLREINRTIKKGAPAFLYLYEDHSENKVKYLSLKIVSIFRVITIRIPRRILYLFCYLASPLVVLLFSYPASFFKNFRVTRRLFEKMPFNFGTRLFSLAGDLYDRFGSPIEKRFSRQEACDLFARSSFCDIHITKLKNTAGWVVWGHKI